MSVAAVWTPWVWRSSCLWTPETTPSSTGPSWSQSLHSVEGVGALRAGVLGADPLSWGLGLGDVQLGWNRTKLWPRLHSGGSSLTKL